MNSSTAWPALTMIMTLRGFFSSDTNSAIECAPRIFLPLARPFTKSSTFDACG